MTMRTKKGNCPPPENKTATSRAFSPSGGWLTLSLDRCWFRILPDLLQQRAAETFFTLDLLLSTKEPDGCLLKWNCWN